MLPSASRPDLQYLSSAMYHRAQDTERCKSVQPVAKSIMLTIAYSQRVNLKCPRSFGAERLGVTPLPSGSQDGRWKGATAMKRMGRKWWLAAVTLLCLVPTTFALQDAAKPRRCNPRSKDVKCRQVPDGGSTLVYALGAGITCLGAMVIRSRRDTSES